MPNNNNFIDGTGRFQQSTENAGVITYGEFSQVSKNTGTIAVSALFTGSAVNSGTIGNYLPFQTSVLVQSNSANWNAAYDAIGNYVLTTDSRLSDAREPLAHTQPLSTIEGFDAIVVDLQNQIGSAVMALSGGAMFTIDSSQVTDFNAAVAAIVPDYAPVTAVAGKTGAVSLETADLSDFGAAVQSIAATEASNAVAGIDVSGTATTIVNAAIASIDVAGEVSAAINSAAGSSLATLVNGTVPASQLPSYVDDVLEYSALASFPGTGETGKIYVDTTAKKIYRWSGSAYIEISPSPGSTDSVAEGSSNLYFTNARASAAAPVQSVAGKTGTVTLSTSDIAGLNAAIAAASSVTSVAGKTGVVTLSTSDVIGLQTALDAKQASGSYATTAITTALSSAIDGKQAAGSYAASSHTHAISAVTGLQTALDAKQASGSYAAAVHTHSTSEITGFASAAAAAAPVQSVAGKTGSVTLSTSDVLGLANLIASNSGDKYLTTSTSTLTIDNGNGKTITIATGLAYTSQQDITVVYNAANHMHGIVVSYNSATGAMVFDVNSKTGSGTYSQWTVNVGGITSGVTSVAGKTGAVTLSSSDIQGLSAAVVAYAPAQAVTSVAGKTGTVTLSTSDVQGFNTNAAAQAPVQSVAGKTGAVVLSAADVVNFNSAADARITAAAGVSVASLVGGLIPSAQLPSYVDDVVEYSALASFPGTGETGKIYVDTTAKKIYRWSGSAYVEISPSPGSTDSVTEGSTNLYFTNARASAAAPVQSVAGKTGAVTLTVLDVASAAPLSALPSSTSTSNWDAVYTTVKNTSASWTTNVNVASAAWQQAYTSVNTNSASWTTNVSVASAAWQQAYTTTSTNSASWQQVYTNVNANSATWGQSITNTNFGAISATSVSLSSAMLSTYSTPVTASGDFLVVTVDNKQRLIRIWDFK